MPYPDRRNAWPVDPYGPDETQVPPRVVALALGLVAASLAFFAYLLF